MGAHGSWRGFGMHSPIIPARGVSMLPSVGCTDGSRAKGRPMKRFLIKYTYRLENGDVEAWHRHVAEFIAALDGDPDLKGRISYHCMRVKDGKDYYHIAEAADDAAPKLLQQHEFFQRYTE